MSEFVIDQETANEEFDRLCDLWELDNEESNMKEDEKIDFSRLKTQIIKSIRRGRLCVLEDESIEYTISDKTKNKNKSGQKLIINRPNGATYSSMDRYKDGQSIHKLNAVLASMTGHAPEFFSDIDGIDLKPLQAIVNLFLAG